jgi:hypothetical protein
VDKVFAICGSPLSGRARRRVLRIAAVRSRRLFLPVIVVLVLAAAGCGGSTTYSEAKSRACLRDAGLKVKSPAASNVVASAAEGGAFVVRFPKNLVVVSFGLDRNGAERIVRGFQRFHGANIGLPDVLHAQHNAVLLWAVHPQDEYVKVIEGCLH